MRLLNLRGIFANVLFLTVKFRPFSAGLGIAIFTRENISSLFWKNDSCQTCLFHRNKNKSRCNYHVSPCFCCIFYLVMPQ